MTQTIKISTGDFGTQILNKRSLVSSNDPILRQKTPIFDFDKAHVHPINISNQMIDALQTYKGFGLACPQVGLSYRMFVMGSPDMQIVAVFNPVILESSKETEIREEGCLSFPGLYIKIRRPLKITVSYQDYNGKEHIAKYTGITSRIFQHESNHLDGILFMDIAGKVSLDIARRKQNKNRNIR